MLLVENRTRLSLYMQQQPTSALPVIPGFLSGGGELGQMIRDFDWSKTAIGPVNTWPQSLRTCIRIMLTSRQPIWIGWGKELIKFYNDPYKAIAGGKHPTALGAPVSVVWSDIWQDIAPLLKQVMEEDTGVYVESQLLIMERNGYPEETYYTFSYTPIPGDDGATAGVICANTDNTERIISERQLKTLTGLGKTLTDCRTNNEIAARTIATIGDNPHDFPFALFYATNGSKLELTGHTAMGHELDLVPPEIDLNGHGEIPALLRQAIETRKMQVHDQLQKKIGIMPSGAWKIPPDKAIVLPVMQAASRESYGFLVVGLNPYRLLDEKYAGFFHLLSDQIATSFSNVYALEEERKRLEAMAEIDRAKTTFFSNISHEFRTPLTLLLGPVEESLHDTTTNDANRFRMEIAWRNALRMQKLVNTLLDFSRIEAGRVEGRFSKVNITGFTEDLASTFRSAIEKAGMQLVFKATPVTEDVYVDTDMWEKIILNLVSNAFKYTHQGSITISVQQEGDHITIAVADTGVGIPEDHLEQIFNRFHRVENTGGRSQEGTGIGLALVKELIKLHKGSIHVNSREAQGTTFTLLLPVGKTHLPADRIMEDIPAAVSNQADSYIEEAGKWLPGTADIIPDTYRPFTGLFTPEQKPLVLLADDNADMREYVTRLLSDLFTVVTAVDGMDALQKLETIQPDLVLSDIMMPRLDGFGLLKKLRGDPEKRNTPVIFLSARAGEEAKVEGLDAGADDYLVKPFSGKELVGRVSNIIRMSQERIKGELRFRNLIMQAPVSITVLTGRELMVEVANDAYLTLVGKKRETFVGKPLWEGLPEVKTQGFDELLQGVLTTGVPFNGREVGLFINREGKQEFIYVNFIYSPIRDLQKRVTGIMVVANEVTQQVLARKKVEESEQALQQHAVLLEQEVEKRTQELNTLNNTLRQSNADLQQFAHVTSHDLKEPVRKIKTFGGRLKDEYGELLPEKGHQFLNKVLHATDRIYSMIEGVLTYSSLNAQEQTTATISLNDTVTSIESDLEVSIQQKHASIQRQQLPQIEGAAILIYQLFYNLINNALKFSRPDAAPVISITGQTVYKDGQEWAEIEVADNGIGFDQQYADKIFDTFARLNSKDQYEGTGIGLALCKKIVERHNGTITAYGNKTSGARFVLLLPVHRSQKNI